MCLLLLAYKSHPDYALVAAANRDEFYDRPTLAARFWPDAPDVLAGLDCKANGTWLGITRSGRFCAITNFRDPSLVRPDAKSRGLVVRGFLTGNASPKKFLAGLKKRASQFNPFNLVAGDREAVYWFSSKTNEIEPLSPGFHGLSNGLPDTPWPKVKRGKAGLRGIVEGWTGKKNPDMEELFSLLSDRTMPPDESLPDTKVGLAWERMLAPIFIQSPSYGTRSSTVILVHRNGEVVFEERPFGSGIPRNTARARRFLFRLS